MPPQHFPKALKETVARQHYGKKVKKESRLKNKHADDSSIYLFVQTSGAFRMPCCVLALLPTRVLAVICYSDHKGQNKAAITAVRDEARLWRIDRNYIAV